MTELQPRGRSHWESNPSRRRLMNSVQPTMTVKCIMRQPLSVSGVEPSTARLEQLLHLQQQQQHLQQQQVLHEQQQLQQQLVRQMQNPQQLMEKEQQLRMQQHRQQIMQNEQHQQLQRQMQCQMQQEQQQHHQHVQNEQRQQRRQQPVQQDQHQLQNQQQQQYNLNTSSQSSPGHFACSSILSSSSTFSGSSTISTCSSSSPSDSGDPDRYKTELCRSYEESGTCRYGSKCLFAHGREELRLLERHPKYKTEFCRTYHTSGFCPYGQRCHFIHSCQNSPLAVVSPGLAIRAGEGPRIASAGQLPMVLAATGVREWNEMQRKFAEPERRFNELEQRLNESKWIRIDMERKLAELELERNTVEQERSHMELSQKSVEPDWQIIQPERRFVEAERKPLEIELSAILQRRRRQLRCGSVGSSCETPPPFVAGLDSFTPSRTSSPMIVDEIRSPSLATSSPFTTYSNPVDIPYPGSVRYGRVSRSLKGSPGFPTKLLGSTDLSFTPPKDVSSAQTPPWTLSDALASRSASRTSSPGLHQFVTISSAARHHGTFFLFDGDALAKLIQRS